jgi:hypothetical protein
MVQFRRLDPLANASPWQRHMKRPVKSFTISEPEYERVQERRPELIVTHPEGVVIGRPYRDFLEVHYGFSEVETFRDGFKPLFEKVVAASSKAEAPRGVVIAFRDRPNRPLAEQIFWEVALEEGKHWVEVDYTAVPEQPEPGNTLAGGFSVREVSDADREAVASIEAEATGLERLTEAGVDSLYASARWLYLVSDGGGRPVAVLSMRREAAGWGIIDEAFVMPSESAQLREPLMRWAIAFLRNNGGRRQRRRVNLDDTEELTLMRSLGFSPAESGVDYTRPVDAADLKAKVDERQSHGTLIKFGDWR